MSTRDGKIRVGAGPLDTRDVIEVARRGRLVEVDPRAMGPMKASRAVVEEAVRSGATVYGVTTGFGALASVRVEDAELEKMQLSLIRSHAAGVGDPLDAEVVRAMLLLRARALAAGYSGVRPDVVKRLVDFLNLEIHPLVPQQGSVGASGDLAQLAHLSLPLIGEGYVTLHGEPLPADEALKEAGLQPLKLSFKEGLSLVNGTEAMLAVGCLALVDTEMLARVADIVCGMSVEALLSTDSAFDPRLHAIRPHPGQQIVAANLRKMLDSSAILASHRESTHAVQDAYSVRCAPQVHGACRDVIEFARGVIERELSAVTDNPIVMSDTGEVLTSGNFHGEPLGFAFDFMAAALAELGSISERRTDRMLDPNHSSGLPPFLTERPGTNSGFMLAQYTQAALVAENRLLAAPATVDNIPTSGTQEDHVSMGWNAALKLRRAVANTALILAVEAMCAAQGMELRAPLAGAPGTSAALEVVRDVIDHLDDDRELGSEIERIVDEVILSGMLLEAVEGAVGELR